VIICPAYATERLVGQTVKQDFAIKLFNFIIQYIIIYYINYNIIFNIILNITILHIIKILLKKIIPTLNRIKVEFI